MAEAEPRERELLLGALRGYLEELKESGVEELEFAAAAGGEGCRAEGAPRARLLFVMDGDGFAGEAGGLLANIVKAMGFAPPEVHLLSFGVDASGAASVTAGELLGRIAAVAPEVVVALGEKAAQLLLESSQPVARLRGSFHDLSGTPLMPSLHPAALLENPALKREVWSDMQQVMKRLSRER